MTNGARDIRHSSFHLRRRLERRGAIPCHPERSSRRAKAGGTLGGALDPSAAPGDPPDARNGRRVCASCYAQGTRPVKFSAGRGSQQSRRLLHPDDHRLWKFLRLSQNYSRRPRARIRLGAARVGFRSATGMSLLLGRILSSTRAAQARADSPALRRGQRPCPKSITTRQPHEKHHHPIHDRLRLGACGVRRQHLPHRSTPGPFLARGGDKPVPRRLRRGAGDADPGRPCGPRPVRARGVWDAAGARRGNRPASFSRGH